MIFENNYLTFIFEKFHNKQVNLNNLIILRPIFEYNLKKLNDPIIAEIRKGDDFSDFFIKKSENIGRFAACKTFQQAKELTELAIETDGFLPFEDFQTFANGILEKYNVFFLEIEYNEVINHLTSNNSLKKGKYFSIFKSSGAKKHNYFKVPTEFKEAKSVNFNLKKNSPRTLS